MRRLQNLFPSTAPNNLPTASKSRIPTQHASAAKQWCSSPKTTNIKPGPLVRCPFFQRPAPTHHRVTRRTSTRQYSAFGRDHSFSTAQSFAGLPSFGHKAPTTEMTGHHSLETLGYRTRTWRRIYFSSTLILQYTEY
jgi:hypothetical protein